MVTGPTLACSAICGTAAFAKPCLLKPSVAASAIFSKQKTACEITSGDWSSDVCSSDLEPHEPDADRGRDSAAATVVRVTATDRGFESSKVGSRLREERERRGMSLRELARRVGVSPSL